MDDTFTKLITTFKQEFGRAPSDKFFSPGRINLIGEHTDYNGGHVFPAAITIGTYGVARKRVDRQVGLYSLNFPDDHIRFAIDDDSKLSNHSWGNFVKGFLVASRAYGNTFDSGFDLVIDGNIPNASGLSSSSSLELLIGVVLRQLFKLPVPRLQLVATGQQAENNYIGVNTGIMDQFAIGYGEKDQAIYLDTNTMTYEMVPIKLSGYDIIIMNTNKRRELTDSKYNERVAETQAALRALQKQLAITSLGQLDSATFEANRDLIGDELLERRARHAVTENERTKLAKQALVDHDLVGFGELLNTSHASLRDDYEVTGPELDTLVATAQQAPGVLGARMTGAGFGGCAIALVEHAAVPAVEEAVDAAYQAKIGYAPSFYLTHIGDGARWVGAVKEQSDE